MRLKKVVASSTHARLPIASYARAVDTGVSTRRGWLVVGSALALFYVFWPWAPRLAGSAQVGVGAYLALGAVSLAILAVTPALIAMSGVAGSALLGATRRELASALLRPATVHLSVDHLPDLSGCTAQQRQLALRSAALVEELAHLQARPAAGYNRPPPEVGAREAMWSWFDEVDAMGLRGELEALGFEFEELRARTIGGERPSSELPQLRREFERILEALAAPAATQYRGLPPANAPRPCIAPTSSEDERAGLERRYRRELRRVARRYAPSAAEAEDLYQEIWLAIWRALPNYRGEGSMRSYLLGIAHRRGASAARRARVLASLPPSLADASCVESELLERERQRWLHEALGRLPSTTSDALSLRLAGASYKDIAHRLGISVANVGVKLHFARMKLRAWAMAEGV